MYIPGVTADVTGVSVTKNSFESTRRFRFTVSEVNDDVYVD